MSKILNTDDLLEVAEEIGCEAEMDGVIRALDELAQKIADHYVITKGDTTWEGKAMGGLCACLIPASPNQPCPPAIHYGDPGGDWGDVSNEVLCEMYGEEPDYDSSEDDEGHDEDESEEDES